MAFCVSCGNQVREAAAFCGKCGASVVTPVRAADEKIARADRLVAEETLKKEHGKLVGVWAAAGTVLTFLINIVLMVIGFSMGGVVGGVFLVTLGIAAAAIFVASLIPSQSERFNIASKKAIDPVTGKPMRMLWFVRWMTAMIALWTIVASTDLFNPPQSASLEAGAAPAAASVPADAPDALSDQRLSDARLALCVAADHEYADIIAGKGGSDKDAIVLANQFTVGQNAGGRAIGHEWFRYKDGEWHDSDCYGLSTAPWAVTEGYAGDPIRLPDGAIAIVVNNKGWVPPGSN